MSSNIDFFATDLVCHHARDDRADHLAIDDGSDDKFGLLGGESEILREEDLRTTDDPVVVAVDDAEHGGGCRHHYRGFRKLRLLFRNGARRGHVSLPKDMQALHLR